VFAPDATLTHATNQGTQKVFHGLNAVTSYYRATYAKFPGFQFKPASERWLTPTIVFGYDIGGQPVLRVPGKCAHLIVIQNGKIESYDWVTYYAGSK
jgi:hypothetical protein